MDTYSHTNPTARIEALCAELAELIPTCPVPPGSVKIDPITVVWESDAAGGLTALITAATATAGVPLNADAVAEDADMIGCLAIVLLTRKADTEKNAE